MKKKEINQEEITEKGSSAENTEITEEKSKEKTEEKGSEKIEENSEAKAEENPPQKKKPLTAAKQGKRKRIKRGALSVVLTVIFVVGIVLLNVIFNMVLDRFDFSADLTDNAVYSIQDSTAKYLSELNDSIEIIVTEDKTVFENSTVSDVRYGKQVSEIINRFSVAGSSVNVEYKALESNPSFYSEYGTDLTNRDIIVKSKNTGRYVILTADEYLSPKYYFNGEEVSAAEYNQYYMYYGGYGGYFRTEYFGAAEKCLLSAIMNVSDQNPVKAAVITEDYGGAVPEALVELIKANTFTCEEIKISTVESIPSDYDFLILNGPLYDLTNDDLNKIDKWLDNGGKLGKTFFYFASASADVLPNLNSYLKEWGIEVQSGYIYQTNENYGHQLSPTYQELEIKDSEYSGGIDTKTKATYGDGLKAVNRLFDESGAYKTTAIVSTYEGAVIAPFDGLQDFDPSTAGQSGSYDVIVESNKVVYEGADGTYSRVYAAGSDLFINAVFLQSQYANNSDIILNIFTTAAGKDKVEVDVTPQSLTNAGIEITAAQTRGITIVFAAVVPLLVIAAGVVVIVRRKRR